jgi:hypothetical protein
MAEMPQCEAAKMQPQGQAPDDPDAWGLIRQDAEGMLPVCYTTLTQQCALTGANIPETGTARWNGYLHPTRDLEATDEYWSGVFRMRRGCPAEDRIPSFVCIRAGTTCSGTTVTQQAYYSSRPVPSLVGLLRVFAPLA